MVSGADGAIAQGKKDDAFGADVSSQCAQMTSPQIKMSAFADCAANPKSGPNVRGKMARPPTAQIKARLDLRLIGAPPQGRAGDRAQGHFLPSCVPPQPWRRR